MHTFRLVGLPYEHFAPLFALPDAELAARGIRRVVADKTPGFPCRVSLVDAAPGEELLLLPFEHQPARSPYRAAGPIYVRRQAQRRVEPAGGVPECVSVRLISARAYDASHLIVDAEVCEGREVAAVLERFFASPGVSYVHLHNAKRGCYSCAAERA